MGVVPINDLSGVNSIFILSGILFFIAIVKKANLFFDESKKIRKDANNNMSKVKYLSQHGMLIKNLKYKVKPVEGSINGTKTVYLIQVIYEIEKGQTKCFESEPKYLTALGRDDGTVDLLIDPNDYTNYFLDFEIY